ncbi:MAG: 4Fe-4S binding protein [Patescibacteria group bacterium]|jgi:pyruvate ferredoxin oxidoreductase delta subunit|nr:4Fe-4S binding protein [Patescibacteria group bacterium]
MKSISTKPNSTKANKTGSWRTYKPEFNHEKCISCGLCSKICPEGCILMEKIKNFDKEKPMVDYDYCKGCGLCASECPVKAINMEKDF